MSAEKKDKLPFLHEFVAFSLSENCTFSKKTGTLRKRELIERNQ